MYRVSPITYLIGGMISDGVAKSEVKCSEIEFLQFQAPSNLTCGDYVGEFVQLVGGSLSNPKSNQTCLYCPVASTDTYLAKISINYSDRWRNFGLIWAFIIFDVVVALGAYWLLRVPKKGMRLKFWKEN
jgi:ATP-binding cassette subfamily G (WHITE) protein 2 (PDR)